MREIVPTKENLEKLGWQHDILRRGWNSGKPIHRERCIGGKTVIDYVDNPLFMLPFGCADRMLYEGLRLWVDGDFNLVKWGFS